MASGYCYQLILPNEPLPPPPIYFQQPPEPATTPPQRTDPPATPSPTYHTALSSFHEVSSAEPSLSPSLEQPLYDQQQAVSSFRKDEMVYFHQEQEKQQQRRHDFNPHIYHCCCGMPVKTGAIVIGCLQFVFIFFQFLAHIAYFFFGYGTSSDDDNKKWPFEIYLNIALTVILFIAFLFFFLAIFLQKGRLFGPWQGVTTLEIIFLIFVGFCCIFQFFFNDTYMKDQANWVNWLAFIGDLLIILIAIVIEKPWWMTVFAKCKKYFADKRKPRRRLKSMEVI